MMNLRTFVLFVSFVCAFFISANAQSIVSINPDSAYRGIAQWIEIQGSGSHFQSIISANNIEIRRGNPNRVQADSFYVFNDTVLKAHFVVPNNFPTGLAEIRVTSQTDGLMRLQNILTIMQNPFSPALVSINPSSGVQGKSYKISITSKFTHFSTSNLNIRLQLGPTSIIADSFNTLNDTLIESWFSFGQTTNTGQYNLIVQSSVDGNLLLNAAFSLNQNPFKPIIYSFSPNTVKQGDTLIAQIDGFFTHFSSSLQMARLYQSANMFIDADSFTLINDSSGMVYFKIPFAATDGLYDFEFQNSADGLITLLDAVSIVINPYGPKIKKVSPDSVKQGEQLVLFVESTVTSFTKYSNATAQLSRRFGATILADSMSSITDTTMYIYFTIPYNIALGLYDFQISSLTDGSLDYPQAVEILASPITPVLDYITPAFAEQGESFYMSIYGKSTHFNQVGLNNVSIQRGFNEVYYADSVFVINDSQLKVFFTIPYSATVGLFNLTVTNSLDGQLTLTQAFEVKAGKNLPEISNINPDQSYQGSSFKMEITGHNTHFVSASNIIVNLRRGFNTNIYADSFLVINDTLINAWFTIPTNAPIALYDLNIENSIDGLMSLGASFSVTLPPTAPQIVSISPTTAVQGDFIQITINCKNTNLSQSTNLSVRLSAGFTRITADSFKIVNDSLVMAFFNIALNANVGNYDIQLLGTPTGTLSLVSSFTITLNPNFPRIDKIQPNKGYQGETVSVKLMGKFTHFTAANNPNLIINLGMGNNLTATNIKIVNDTMITADLNIDSNQAAGKYDVILLTSNEGNLFLYESFEVIFAPTSPHIALVDPDKAYQGQSIAVNVYTKNTMLTKGSGIEINIQFGFNNIITATSITVKNDTFIIANFDIPTNARLGFYILNVNNTLSGDLSLVEGFEIVLPPTQPQIVSITPAKAQAGKSVNVNIKSLHTNYASELPNVQISNGQTNLVISNLKAINDTLLTGLVEIPLASPAGFYNLTVNNNTFRNLRLNGAFEVVHYQYNPIIKSVSPDSVQTGITVVLTINASETSFKKADVIEANLTKQAVNIESDVIQMINDTILKVTFSIPESADLGLYNFVLFTDVENTLILENAIRIYWDEISIEENSKLKLRLYPNPATEKLYIDLENFTAKKTVLELVGLDGKKLIYRELVNESNIEIDVSSLPSGIYILNVNNDTGNTSSVFVKK